MRPTEEKFYKKIAEEVLPELPENFVHLWMYCGVQDEYNTDLWTRVQLKQEPRVYRPLQLTTNTLSDLDDLFRDYWNASGERGKQWTSITFQIDHEGNFTVDYDYEKAPPGATVGELEEAWTAKYLAGLKVKLPMLQAE